MLDRIDDIIVAVSSAPGHGPLGILRVSGPGCIDLLTPLTRLHDGSSLARQPGFTCSTGEFRIDDELSLPARFLVFRAPRSYTRQDMIEIHAPGSPAVLELIRGRLIERGAVAASPGEFTARAFLNGAMDLATAEAVGAIIRAESDTQLRAARRMMDGSLTKAIDAMRDELAEVVALVEAQIDFAEEPIEFISPEQLQQRLAEVGERLQGLVAGSAAVERLDALPRILLLGRPNAGKSSLMNRLSGTNRAICAAVAGTTRDLLSAPIALGRGEAILLDAAGVDRSMDEVLAAAREMTLRAAASVDLICVVIDASQPDFEVLAQDLPSLEGARRCVAINKSDLVNSVEIERLSGQAAVQFAAPVIAVSATTGQGLDELRRRLVELLSGSEITVGAEASLISERQREALGQAIEAIRQAQEISAQAPTTLDGADLLAFELREALDALGSVTGSVTTEDLLGRVFARFCIGK